MCPGSDPAAPTPPAQPESGPGGSDYRFTTVTDTTVGVDEDEYRIFEPAGVPAGESLPVIGFLHGWSAMDPAPYALWIAHLVKKGNIVIYPRYQRNLLAPPTGMTASAAQALRQAWVQLDGVHHVHGDRERFALVGHSLGGTIAANIAAITEAQGLPRVRALMAAHPGDSNGANPRRPSMVGDYATIPADILLLAVVGDDDLLVGRLAAKKLFIESSKVPPGNKDFIVVHSDAHGAPALTANHLAPVADARRGADALDFYGYWKLFDALSSAAFTGSDPAIALGDTAEQRAMGLWSDGIPVRPLDITHDP